MLSQIGVRQLVEFLFRSGGDLNVAAGSDNSMQAGGVASTVKFKKVGQQLTKQKWPLAPPLITTTINT